MAQILTCYFPFLDMTVAWVPSVTFLWEDLKRLGYNPESSTCREAAPGSVARPYNHVLLEVSEGALDVPSTASGSLHGLGLLLGMIRNICIFQLGSGGVKWLDISSILHKVRILLSLSKI